MLAAYPSAHTDSTLSSAVWVDLVDPTPVERALFEKTLGLRVPTQGELGEIEATSRLRMEQGALYMTAPLIFAADNEPWILVPTGFVLSKDVLMTVRSAKSAAFDAVAKELGANEKFEPSLAYVRILEELVDHTADLLEVSGRDLDDASHVIFRQDNSKRLSRETSLLRQLMIRTGRNQRTDVACSLHTGLSRPDGQILS
jgi:magnesium transporter